MHVYLLFIFVRPEIPKKLGLFVICIAKSETWKRAAYEFLEERVIDWGSPLAKSLGHH